METSTVPVTRDGLRLHRDLGTEFLGNTVKEEPSHPELVTHLDSLAGTDLEFPLGRHNFGVGTRDLDAGVKASLVVRIDNITAHHPASANTAVVRSLRSRVAVLGPSIGPVLHVEESVLLLETKPRNVLGMGFHQFGALVAVVELVGRAIGIPAFRKD